jgi:hypothetical protein
MPDPRKKLVRQKAIEISQALVAGDFATVVQLTYPKVVEMTGGSDKMIALLQTGMQKMKGNGVEITSVKVGTPSEFHTAGADLFAIVPTAIELKVPGGKLTQKSFVVGISADAGETWLFADGNGLSADQVKTVFPNFPDSLPLPAPQPAAFKATK